MLSSLFLVACDNNSDHDEPGFPDGFLFGTATAAHQVESNNTNNDWYAWETLGRIRDGHSNLNGPDYWNNYSNDFDFAQLLGTNAYRFSLEWSKIEPVKDQYDRAAIDHYHLMIDDMRAKGMQPVVTLQHFTLPIWIHNPTPDVANANEPLLPGWADQSQDPLVVTQLVEFAADMAKEFGGEVDWWITLNEPMVYYANGYLVGDFPPGIGYKNDITAGVGLGFEAGISAYPLHEGDSRFGVARGIALAPTILGNMIKAHIGMYNAIKAADQVDADSDGANSRVSISKHHLALRAFDGSRETEVALAQVDYFWNQLFWNAILLGKIDADLDGEAEMDISASGTFPTVDFLGINYYTRRDVVQTSLIAPLLGLEVADFGFLEGFPVDTSLSQSLNPALAMRDDAVNRWNCLGWEINPLGLQETIEFYADHYPGLGILISENGTDNNADRASFVVDMLDVLEQMIDAGHPILGYMHWSLMDNFEWERGYYQKFGLLEVDFDNLSPNSTRSVTDGYLAYQTIIAERGVSPFLRESVGTLADPENTPDNSQACALVESGLQGLASPGAH